MSVMADYAVLIHTTRCALITGITRRCPASMPPALVRGPPGHPRDQVNRDIVPEMTGDQLKRFDRWRQRLPENTMYLTDLVIDEIVPVFREQGFDRFPDYAGESVFAVGPNCIPLQRRTGLEW